MPKHQRQRNARFQKCTNEKRGKLTHRPKRPGRPEASILLFSASLHPLRTRMSPHALTHAHTLTRTRSRAHTHALTLTTSLSLHYKRSLSLSLSLSLSPLTQTHTHMSCARAHTQTIPQRHAWIHIYAVAHLAPVQHMRMGCMTKSMWVTRKREKTNKTVDVCVVCEVRQELLQCVCVRWTRA